MLLIIAVSTVVGEGLAHENLNYDKKTKTYVPIWARSISYQKRAVLVKFKQVSEAGSSLQMFFKIAVLKNFANSTGKHLCWRYFLIKLQSWKDSIKKRLQHRSFPVKFAKFLRTPFLHNISSGCFWLLTRSREPKPMWLSVINIRFSCKRVFAVAKVSTSER